MSLNGRSAQRLKAPGGDVGRSEAGGAMPSGASAGIECNEGALKEYKAQEAKEAP